MSVRRCARRDNSARGASVKRCRMMDGRFENFARSRKRAPRSRTTVRDTIPAPLRRPGGAAVPPSSPARTATIPGRAGVPPASRPPSSPARTAIISVGATLVVALPCSPPVQGFGRPQGAPLQMGRCGMRAGRPRTSGAGAPTGGSISPGAPAPLRRPGGAAVALSSPERTAIISVGATLVVALPYSARVRGLGTHKGRPYRRVDVAWRARPFAAAWGRRRPAVVAGTNRNNSWVRGRPARIPPAVIARTNRDNFCRGNPCGCPPSSPARPGVRAPTRGAPTDGSMWHAGGTPPHLWCGAPRQAGRCRLAPPPTSAARRAVRCRGRPCPIRSRDGWLPGSRRGRRRGRSARPGGSAARRRRPAPRRCRA